MRSFAHRCPSQRHRLRCQRHPSAGQWRLRTHRRHRPGHQGHGSAQGFILPLAISASLLLLLGSLSVQSAALQSRLSQAAREELRQQEDAMISAAQRLVAALNQSHPCLLPLPLASWPEQGRSCADPLQQDAVQRGLGEGRAWRLLDWQPRSDSAELLLELEPSAPAGRARRAALSVLLGGEPLRASSVRLLGLRGITP